MSVTVVKTAVRGSKSVSGITRYLLIREAGGLGDDIRVSAVGRMLKLSDTTAHITVLGLEHFRSVYRHLEGIDRFVPCRINLKYRRGRGEPISRARYLKDYLEGYDNVIDLFCPAYNYEREELHYVEFERTDMFLKEAGFNPREVKDPVPRWVVTEAERREANNWLSSSIDPYKPIIGLHRRSTDASRTYREDFTMELINRLYDQGYNVILFDVTRDVGNNPAIPAIKLDIDLVAAIIERLSVLVAVDSGLLHIAGALGVPIVGLFGSTEGKVIGKHYDCTSVVPYGYYGEVPSPCGNPCYYRPQRGWTTKCRETGCFWLNLIYPPMVVDAVVKRMAIKKEETKCVSEVKT